MLKASRFLYDGVFMNAENNPYTFTSCPKCHAINKISISKISAAICGKCQTALPFHQLVSEVDDVGLTKLIQKSDLPVIIDFWAPWCGPCKIFAPTFEAVSQLSKGKLVFVKLNTEKYPHTSQAFNIRGIPSLLVFKSGKEIARESGAHPLDYFKNWVQKYY
jgi:thioredoxin 2